MKHTITLLAFLLMLFAASAQNLVQNYSFENYLICPAQVSQFDSVHVTGWARGTCCGTADYFNACYTPHPPANSLDVPRNFMGYQPAFDGNAYAGIFTYVSDNSDWREYLRGNCNISKGGYYRVSIMVSLGDSCRFASGGLGVFFYINGIGADLITTDHLDVIPQIDYTGYGIIADTVNWVQLVDTFYADSSYTHLMIGNFKNDSNTAHSVYNDSAWQYFSQSYYFVDDVEVTSLSPNAVIDLKHQKKSVDIPSAFSPNGDGENDVLYIRGSGYTNIRLRIYNRLGQSVFETVDAGIGWDGTYRGQPLPADQYGYVLLATFADGSTTQKTGSLTLLR